MSPQSKPKLGAAPKLKLAKKPDSNIIEYGRKVCLAESQAISALSELLDSAFEASVKLIVNRPNTGRIIASGMGKAGFIARKVSATFASIGISSFFLHPAEALHGDLGRFSAGDIALLFSNLGETPEIIRMLGPIKRMGCPIIAVTGAPNSSLAKHSDHVISIGKLEETGPLGLAPTTSTTAMLAVGDALAMTVLEQLGLTKEQFAQYHPAGSLGRKLTLVSELMRHGEQHAIVSEQMKTRDVLHVYTQTKGRPGAATIVNDSGKLVGIFTDGDLRRCIDTGLDFLDKPVSAVMARAPKTVNPEMLVQEALHIMSEYKIDQVIVVDSEQRPVGLLDIQDILEIRV